MGSASENHSLADKAYTIVRHRILRGELAIGDVISRRKIGAELGISLLPVMEALLRLEVEGLLESRPRAGPGCGFRREWMSWGITWYGKHWKPRLPSCSPKKRLQASVPRY